MARLPRNEALADPVGSSAETRGDRLLDLAHLSRQCMGDEDLESEILSQFRTQSLTLSAQMSTEDTSPLAAQADIAHRLRGSALAVGAWAVASAAEAAETCGRTTARGGPEGATRVAEMSRAISTLSEAVLRTVTEIDRLRK